jgi:hypothetical protein
MWNILLKKYKTMLKLKRSKLNYTIGSDVCINFLELLLLYVNSEDNIYRFPDLIMYI